MTSNQKILVTVCSLVLIGGAGYLIYTQVKKGKKKDALPDVPPIVDAAKQVTAPAAVSSPAPATTVPPIPPAPKFAYANTDNVNVRSIYDSKVLATVKKGDFIGRITGDHSKDAYYVTTTKGNAFVAKGYVTVK